MLNHEFMDHLRAIHRAQWRQDNSYRPELTKRPDLTVKGTNPEPVGLFLQVARAFGRLSPVLG
jgi:hypothetical protein